MATFPHIVLSGTLYGESLTGGFSFPPISLSGTVAEVPSLSGGFTFPKFQLTDGWQVETRTVVPDGRGLVAGGAATIRFPIHRFVGSGGVIVGVPAYINEGATQLWRNIAGYGHVTSTGVTALSVGGWHGSATIHDNSRAHFVPWVPPKAYAFTSAGAALIAGVATTVFYPRNYRASGGFTVGGSAAKQFAEANTVKFSKPTLTGRGVVYKRRAVAFIKPVVAGQAAYYPSGIKFYPLKASGYTGRALNGSVPLKRPRIAGVALQGNRIAFIPPEVRGAGNVYPAGTGAVALPLLDIAGKGYASESIRATIVFARPVIEATAASIPPGQGQITFRHGRVSASVTTTVDGVSFRKPVVAATLLNPKSFKAKLRFSAPFVHGTGAGVTGSGRVVFKRLQARSVLDRPLIASGAVTLRKLKSSGTLLLSRLTAGAVVFDTLKLHASMVVATNAVGSVVFYRAAVSGIGAEAQPVLRAYAVNLATGAVSELPGYAFESMSGMWAVSDTGIEKLTGFTDNDEPIHARALGGTTEHGTPALKRALALYVKSTFHPETKSDLRAIAEADGVERTYRTSVGFGAGVATRRAQLGRGVMASSWRYGFEVDYQDNFSVVSFTPEATVTSRGV